MKRLLFATAAFVLLAGGARASIIPTLTSVTPSGSNYEFTYSASLVSDAGVVPGDKLVILDFAGFKGFGSLSSNITATTELSTAFIPTPGSNLVAPPGYTDDPTIPNLVFTYTGPAFHNAGGPFSEVDFTVSALSSFKNTKLDGFSAVTVKNNGPAEGTPIYDVGSTSVPVAGGVPEPASWALMILGFGGLGAALRRRELMAA